LLFPSMAQHSTSIRIPTPCHESWATMTLTATGRHCVACTQTVVDFTQKTDAEILAYFQQADSVRTCGRFRAEQVERPLSVRLPPLPARRWQVWLTSLLVAALATQSCQSIMEESISTEALASQEITPDSATAEAVPQPTPISSGVADSPKLATKHNIILMEGTVIDDSFNVPVEGAFLFINDTKYGAVTDKEGKFTLLLPVDWEPLKAGLLTLRVKAEPFTFLDKVVQIKLFPTTAAQPLVIRLLSQPERGIVMGKPYGIEHPVTLPTAGKSH
jgi:hypothetical protein